jgi:hypothetical protein
MRVIHFTHRAADPLESFGASGTSFLPLADAEGGTHISCLYLAMNGKIDSPSITIAAALLVVHGRVTVTPFHDATIDFFAGMGAIFQPNEPYTLLSDAGAILLIVESVQLTAHDRAISTPRRIEGATWPNDSLAGPGGITAM